MDRGRKQHRQLAALVRRAQAGDRTAFEELYATTAQAQYFTLVGKVGRATADDLLQELYLIVWQKIDRVHPDAIISYLNATTRNLCLRHLDRSGTTSAPTPYSDEYLEGAQSNREPLFAADSVADPAVASADRDQVAHLAAALHSELDDQEREAVVLRYYQDLKLDEVAEALEVSKATVKRVISRALDKLRAKLGMLPVGAALSEAMTAAVESLAAPDAARRALEESTHADDRARNKRWAMAAAAIAAAVGIAVFGMSMAVPNPEVTIVDDPQPTAAPVEAPSESDTAGPELQEVSMEEDITVLTVADASGTASVTCEDVNGTIFQPLPAEGDNTPDTSTAATGTSGAASGITQWRFALPDGTYTIHATDALGNRSTGTVTACITPDPLAHQNES